MKNKIAVGICVALLLYVAYVLCQEGCSKENKGVPSKPGHPPITDPKWTSRGQWAIPFKVRYAVAFEDSEGKQGELSDWSPWYSSSQFSHPQLKNFPTAARKDEVAFVNLFRHFEGEEPKVVAKLAYPVSMYYVDTNN
jgi:hypothetical protein